MISGVTEIWIHTRRGIEAVITRRSWKPFVRKGAWVRIPPSPFLEKYPSWLKGLPWKGSRSLVAARGFKSLLLRLKFQDAECWKKLRKKFKKLLTNRKSCDKLAKLSLRKTRTAQNLENWTVCKTLKILIKWPKGFGHEWEHSEQKPKQQ